MRTVVYYIKETLRIEHLWALFVGDGVNRRPRSIIPLKYRKLENMRQVPVTDSIYTPQLKSCVVVGTLIHVWTALTPIMLMKTSGIYEPNIPSEEDRAVVSNTG
jgi:hypothetical protein